MFFKEHKAFVEEQRKVDKRSVTIARLQKQIETLTAGLQKVSAQLATASPSGGGLGVSRLGPQTVLNDREETTRTGIATLNPEAKQFGLRTLVATEEAS